MALSIKNEQVESLAQEVATLTGESKTQAIRRALEERHARLVIGVVRRDRKATLRAFLEREVWSHVPQAAKGRKLTRKQEAAILGYFCVGNDFARTDIRTA